MVLPNFLIIGATKAGTTTLYDQLRQHPDVFMPRRIKEPRFFCYKGVETGFDFPIKTRAQYEALFAEGAAAKAIGEATPHYLSVRVAAANIHATIPRARLIASLRNPAERAFSIYQMNLRERGRNAGVPFLEALPRDRWLRETYHDNLARFHGLFAREQMRIVLFDDLQRDARGVLAGLLEFLEVDAGFTPVADKVSNPGGLPRFGLLHRLATTPTARALGRALPDPVMTRLRDLRSANLRKVEMTEAERAGARAFFREDVLRVQDLIGRDLSTWLAETPARRAAGGA